MSENKTETENLRVSGNILKEVSEKLPNMFIALNELVKNSYDACASTVEIIFSEEDKYLIVKDDGEGMDRAAVKTLFSVASSTKKYGTKNKCGRITQGSKGLGFLSVFKFGKNASWDTIYKNERRDFEINITDYEKIVDVSKKDLLINVSNLGNNSTSGTIIKILMNEDTIKEFKNQFIDSKESFRKLLHLFIDDNFIIKVNFNNDIIVQSEKKVKFNDKFEKKVIYNVLYDSNHQRIIFKHNNIELFSEAFPLISKRFEIDLNLEIYDLHGTSVDYADPLFIFRSPSSRFLAPILYINNNLFHSAELFEPGITRPIKSNIVLSQIAGFIKIISADPELEFNSERSKLVDSSFSKELTKFLQDINIFIQTKGSEKKYGVLDISKVISKQPKEMKPLIGDDYDSNIPNIINYCVNTNFHFRNLITGSINGNNIELSFVNKSLGIFELPKLKKDLTYPSEIKLDADFKVYNIPNEQINLRDFIIKATDSKGNDVKASVGIYIDGILSSTEILPNYPNECRKIVDYVYQDPVTGKCQTRLTINIKKPEYQTLIGQTKNVKLIPNFAKNGYVISFCPHVNEILNQINSLDSVDQSNRNKFDYLYAVCLRSLFDLSIQALVKEGIKPNIIKQDGNLPNMVNAVIKLMEKNIREKIASNTGMEVNLITNLVLLSDGNTFTTKFGDAVKLSNISAHSAMVNISNNDIDEISKKLGFFLIFVNEILSNQDVKKLLT